jgi:uncharacterized YigZ family protein
MAQRDEFRIINHRTKASLRLQRSEFIAIAFPAESVGAFEASLEDIVREYHDATHHCWAWRGLVDGRIEERSSDAGEPSGTAGRPILNAIGTADLVNLGLVVVRYFGGVKLGTGGLSRAYRDAARQVLGEVKVQTILLYDRISIVVPFPSLSVAYRLLDPPHIVLVEERYGEQNVFVIDVRKSIRSRVEQDLIEKRFRYAVS